MKRKNRIGVGVKTPLVLFFAVLFVLVDNVQGGEQNLIISEIMYDPKGVDAGQSDWVELYNGGDSDIVLKKTNFGLIDEEELNMGTSGRYLNCHGLSEDVTIASGKYIIFTNNTEDFSGDYDDVTAGVRKVSFSLSGDGDTIRFSDDKCTTFHTTASYDDSWGGSDNGKTLELKDMDGKYEKDNWQESFVEGGTPGMENSKHVIPEPVKPKIYPGGISITELFPSPFQSQYEEYIELYNGTSEDIDLLGWSLHDASKAGKYTFPASLMIKAKNYMAVFKKDFKFALNNSGDESVTLFDPNSKEVAKTSYDGSKRNVSYNFDGSGWHWSKVLTPGAENILNNEPYGTLKIDEDVFRNVYADFSISTGDLDGDKVKVTWDFGDGHKSYLAKTRHKYEATGIYSASVKLSDGSEDVLKEFMLEVKKFPHQKVSIVGVNANPRGSDSVFETITIKNNSKKKINLEGWSIATGSKSLTNHPITEKFTLKKDETKEISREISKFSLNNKKGKIELRYPDGKVSSDIKYDHGKTSIEENEMYRKVKGGWEWFSQKPITKIQDTNKKQEAITNNQNDADVEKMDENSAEETTASVEIKRENKLVALNDENVKIELLKSHPHVLGAETVREIDGIYFLTSQTPQKEHYVIVFLKNIFFALNLFVNSMFNKIFTLK